MRRLAVAATVSLLGVLESQPLGAQEPPIEVIVRAPESQPFDEDGQTTGTRAPRPTSDVPQAVTVLPSSVLKSAGARRVEDVMLLVPSVGLGAGFGGVWDDYVVRGSRIWSGTMYRNGFLGGYSSLAAFDVVNVERVEVLRGPAAALYGPGLPGGTLNIVTKRPLEVERYEVGMGLGSFDTARLTLDFTGPLGSASAYRLTLGADRSAGHRDFNESARLVLNPVFSFAPDARTRWLIETQLFSATYRPDPGGVPIVDGDPFALPAARSYADPDAPKTRFDGMLLRSELRRELTPSIVLRLGAQVQQALEEETVAFPIGLREDGRTLDRVDTHLDLRSRDVALQGGIEVRGELGGVEHDAVLGVDARYEHVDYRLAASDPASDPFPIDLYRPVYGSPRPALHTSNAPDDRWTYGDAGVYLNDKLRLLAPLDLVLSGRLDGYRQTSRAAGSESAEGEIAPSGRVGLIVRPLDVLSTYASVSYGFWPVLGVSASGALLEPERSRGLEMGARVRLFGGALTLDGAVFSLQNQNISVPDPERPEFQVQRGASRTNGLELAATARVASIFRVIGAYTATDAQVTEDADPSLVGRPLPSTARYSASAWGELDLPLPRVDLITGFGARLVGPRRLNDGARVPGYSRLDSSLGVRLSSVELEVLVQNLLDRAYVQSGNDALSVLRGPPRTWLATLTVGNR
jgi:iron complex outermembrane receptor protein